MPDVVEKANKFLLYISALLMASILLINPLKKVHEYVNIHIENDKKTFFTNFFTNKVQIFDEKNFITNYNKLILGLHIEAKRDNIFISTSPLNYKNSVECDNCNSNNFNDVDGNSQCNDCGLMRRNIVAIAWSDVSRVHSIPIYSYNRKVQFKECILQYQGKSIPPTNLGKLDISVKLSKFEFIDLLKNVTKNRINLDMVHLLYYQTFNITPPDLSRYENQLLRDFDIFHTHYSTMINEHVPNQFLLYQFLRRYGYKITTDDVLLSETYSPSTACLDVFKLCDWSIYL